VRDPDLARDVVQNALCKALENLDAFRGEASLAGWLFTICRHEISGHYRRRGRAPDEVELAEETPAVRAALESLPASFSGPQEALEDEELARQVHTTLDHLPPHYGRALEWKYVDGLAVKEIASRLDLGSKAAESLLTRARKAFRDAFSSFGLSFEGWVSSSGLPSTATQPPGIAQEPSVAEEL
jgi:RNA polymerase sigma-70 factor (ECF subfamily)